MGRATGATGSAADRRDTTVTIIGAGPAGLTAAWELARMGIRSTVLEADDQVGGLSRTMRHGGYRFDIGGHRFFSKVRWVNELWQEMMGDDFLRRPRLSRIYYRGRFFDYPLRPLNALTGLGPVEAVRCIASYVTARLFPIRDERSFEAWVVNRFGRRLYEIFFRTYTEKVWGIPCAEISADWATQRIRNLSLGEALRDAFFRDGRGGQVASLIEEFQYPRHGPGMMWERFTERLAENGTEVRCGVRIDRILHRDGRVVAIGGSTADGERYDAPVDQLISSMPVRELLRAFDPPPPPEVRRAAESLRYRDYLTVVLIVDREHVFDDNWIYIHSPEVGVGRVQNYKNWSPEMVPDPSHTALGLEYFLSEDDAEWEWSEERWIEQGLRDMRIIGLVDPDDVVDGKLVRAPKAYPVYDHHYRDHLRQVRTFLDGIENLQTIGRNGQHRYNNQDHSMLAGLYAARNIVGESRDVWVINTEQEYHEETRPDGVADRLVPAPLTPQDVEGHSPEEVIRWATSRLDPVASGVALGVVAGLTLTLASVGALLQPGSDLRTEIALLGEYLAGYRPSWSRLWIGVIEAALGGYVMGHTAAWLRNRVLLAYVRIVARRAARNARRRLLDRV